MTRAHDFAGRSYECSACGYLGDRDGAYAHARDCPATAPPSISPRYWTDRYRAGEQARLGRWSE